MVVHYVDGEGLKYAQIAEIMDTPKGTVLSRLHRRRRRLRFRLAGRRNKPPRFGARLIEAYLMHPTQNWVLDRSAPRPGERRHGRLLIGNALTGHPSSSPVMDRSNYLESATPQMADERTIRTACRNAGPTHVIIVGSLAILGVVNEYELPW
jgi:hypothetical protein